MGRRALVIANGELHYSIFTSGLAEGNWDMVACVNGGTFHALRLGIHPDVIVGDLDSACADILERAGRDGVEVILHPVEKDKTDLDLALEYVIAAGIGYIVGLAPFGGRLDHTLANVLLILKAASLGATLLLTDGRSDVRLVAGGEVRGSGSPGDYVSLIPVEGDAGGVFTEGLKYELRGNTLRAFETLGVSNELMGAHYGVRVESGKAVLIHTRREGFPPS